MKASLSELEAVAAIARLGGFRAAARELGVSSSSLSHAVLALEARLNVRLFNRTTRSVALTTAGEAFVAEILPALAAIDGAVERATESQARPSGMLRLNTSPGAAKMVLRPLLIEYLRRYPDMALEVATDNALVDIVALGFDAGFRLAEAVPPDMVAVPVVSQSRMIVVGSSDYFRERAVPLRPGDLMQHACIRARMASGRIYHWEFSRRGESVEIDVPGPLILDDSELMLQAALGGVGLAYLSDHHVHGDVEAGRLVPVLEEWTPSYDGLCLYFPGRRHVPAKLRALIDLVRELRSGSARAPAVQALSPHSSGS